MEKNNLLFEIGLEDLPARNLNIFSEKIKKNIEKNLSKNKITFDSINNFYTNIRLVFVVNNIPKKIILEKKLIKGPPLNICFDKKVPTKTGLGFAKKHNVDIKKLSTKEIDGNKYLFFEQPEITINTKDKLSEVLENSISNIEDQKEMRWGDSNTSFIRPIRWLLLLLGDENIHLKIMGIETQEYTFGNKSLPNKKIKINDVDDYFSKIKNEEVEISQNKRKEIIKNEIEAIIESNFYDKTIDLQLVDELANMTEYPYVFLGKFPEKFLDLPQEVLKYVIQDTQKYSLVFKKKKIINYFIGISNVKINKNIIQGNERVINPRLDDAQFFISKDLDSNIFQNKEFLKRVIFHKKLGSMFEKVQRITKISSYINNESYQDEKLLHKDIAELCKLDLISNMVVEIPKLQGYIGSYYALKSGINNIVAEGIKDHYAPRNPEDSIPKSIDAQIVSIADKLDTIVGMFLANEKPSGTRDPLGIRRSTNGLLKILLNTNQSINMTLLVNKVYDIISLNFNDLKKNKKGLDDCHIYFKEKLISLLIENYNFKDNVVLSVINNNKNINPYEILKKIEAINTILADDDYQKMFNNAKRVANILKKSDLAPTRVVNENLLRESSEKILYNKITEIEEELNSSLVDNNYIEYLKKLNSLSACTKIFFEDVMINDKDENIKLNRLSLLYLINSYYTNLANVANLAY
ncbi:MAG: glycine--tRNA ligase subunit beta [Gammaproteobacteria bacterium]|nr:glycine--tRNA ligase subunit beta [Gammaproteobacteria bacterium]